MKINKSRKVASITIMARPRQNCNCSSPCLGLAAVAAGDGREENWATIHHHGSEMETQPLNCVLAPAG